VTENPWQALDHERTTQFGSPVPMERHEEHALVDFEYAETAQLSRQCSDATCIGTMHYRATVGALQCEECRGLARVDGTPIQKQQKEAEAE
jgi:hypothetical protein